MYNGTSQVSAGDLQFPMPEDLVNYTSQFKPVVATIPPQLIAERSQLQDASSGMILLLFCHVFLCFFFIVFVFQLFQ